MQAPFRKVPPYGLEKDKADRSPPCCTGKLRRRARCFRGTTTPFDSALLEDRREGHTALAEEWPRLDWCVRPFPIKDAERELTLALVLHQLRDKSPVTFPKVAFLPIPTQNAYVRDRVWEFTSNHLVGVHIGLHIPYFL